MKFQETRSKVREQFTSVMMLTGSLFQYEYGDEASKAVVMNMMPNKVKKRRKVQTEAGVSVF